MESNKGISLNDLGAMVDCDEFRQMTLQSVLDTAPLYQRPLTSVKTVNPRIEVDPLRGDTPMVSKTKNWPDRTSFLCDIMLFCINSGTPGGRHRKGPHSCLRCAGFVEPPYWKSLPAKRKSPDLASAEGAAAPHIVERPAPIASMAGVRTASQVPQTRF